MLKKRESKALIRLIENVSAVIRKDFKTRYCENCPNEILCFSASINPNRIKNCKNATGLVRAFVELVQMGMVEVYSNFSIRRINFKF